MRAGRSVAAIAVTLVAAPVGLWAGLLAAATLVAQVLAGFGVILNANWIEVFNPAVWFGFDNIAGNGSLLDSLAGGAGAPGGTFGRYVAFIVLAGIAAGCYTAVRAVWAWTRRDG
jgi:hypothetical protein